MVFSVGNWIVYGLTPDSDANDALPDFSPDGRHIVFRSTRDGNAELYVMDSAKWRLWFIEG